MALPPPVTALPPPVANEPAMGLPPPLASFFGLRSRTLMFFFFDFDISAFLFWVVCCVFRVSDAEQQFTSAGDVLFWNQIIEAD